MTKIYKNEVQVGVGDAFLIIGDEEYDEYQDDYYFGEGYPNDLNRPAGMRVVLGVPVTFEPYEGIGGDSEILNDGHNIGNGEEAYVLRDTVRIDRTNEAGAVATAGFDIVQPNGIGTEDWPRTQRTLTLDDPDTPNGLGGYAALFAGFSASTNSRNEAMERVISMTAEDYGTLLRKPPHQIGTQWPPGDGTPVVYATVQQSITPGTRTVTLSSVDHIYPGKKLFAYDADGTHKERITVLAVDYAAKTITAVFAYSKTYAQTTVHEAMHHEGRGIRLVKDAGSDDPGAPGAWVPASMTNIHQGSVLYCYQSQTGDKRAEYVVVDHIGDGGFYAAFSLRKKHYWHVEVRWFIAGGITDRELIADGWKQHVDVPKADGTKDRVLVDVQSLLDTCYNYAEYPMYVDKSLVSEINLSLPHGKFEGMTPDEVLQWVVQQNADNTVDPRYYMSFMQPRSLHYQALHPSLRYYDAKDITRIAPIALTDQDTTFEPTRARYVSYARSVQSTDFFNGIQVLGANDAYGEYTDIASVTDPASPNYIGRRCMGKAVRDNTLTKNSDCVQRAKELVEENARDRVTWTVVTYAQLSPLVLWEPQAVSFDSLYEKGLPDNLVVIKVSLAFTADGLAQWTFTLGDPLRFTFKRMRSPGNHTLATVSLDERGSVVSVGAPSAKRFYTNFDVVDDGKDVTHLVDSSDAVEDDGPGTVTAYLPPAAPNKGRIVVIKKVDNSLNPVVIAAYQRGAVVDNIELLDTYELSGYNQSVMLQSEGDPSGTGLSGFWRVISSASEPVTSSILSMQENDMLPLIYGVSNIHVSNYTLTDLTGGSVALQTAPTVRVAHTTLVTAPKVNVVPGPGVSIDGSVQPGQASLLFKTVPNLGAGVGSSYRDEFLPAAGATSQALTYIPSGFFGLMTVARGGVEQSSRAGQFTYDADTNSIVVTSAFTGSEELVVSYLIGGIPPTDILPPSVIGSGGGGSGGFSGSNRTTYSLMSAPGSPNGEAPADWYALDFDDSAWVGTDAGRGELVVPGEQLLWSPGGLLAQGQSVLLRHTFQVAEGYSLPATLLIAAANALDEIWVNGVNVGSFGSPATSLHTIELPAGSVVGGIENVIAIKATAPTEAEAGAGAGAQWIGGPGYPVHGGFVWPLQQYPEYLFDGDLSTGYAINYPPSDGVPDNRVVWLRLGSINGLTATKVKTMQNYFTTAISVWGTNSVENGPAFLIATFDTTGDPVGVWEERSFSNTEHYSDWGISIAGGYGDAGPSLLEAQFYGVPGTAVTPYNIQYKLRLGTTAEPPTP